MRNKLLIGGALLGLLIALVSAVIFGRQPPAQSPAFAPAANPYAKGIYANGIIESDQTHGANINIYPEVSGPITQVLVVEGASVHKGDALLTIDESVQRATAEQQLSQAQAAEAALEALQAQPRPETLHIAQAQVENARAVLENAQDQRAKQERAFQTDPKSVSRDALDNVRNAQRVAETNLRVVEKQLALTRAGAWSYDITNQQRQHDALLKAYAASSALLDKYTLRAPTDGVVLAIQTGVGSFVSPQGAYDTYTQGMNPLIVMSTSEEHLQVRAYIDEILVQRLADPSNMSAQMFIRGSDVHLPLQFVRILPYVSPKIELSNQRQERVDLRVLPIIFNFRKPAGLALYPGQLVDVYVSSK